MSKKERRTRAKNEGLHEIKNKYRAHPVNKKRKGLVFTAKKKRRLLKTCTSLSAIFVLILGVFAIAMAFWKEVPNFEIPDGFETVSYEPPTDGSRPDTHSALENIGYLNYRFRQQENWYCEMHGTTSTPVGPQSVNTFKQYSDGVLIMADVTSSGMVKEGRQFCYVGDEVMWRKVSDKAECSKVGSLEEMESIVWNSDSKKLEHMTIPAFKELNGLPGTEMTVYVINEKTLDHADDVVRVSPEAAKEWEGASYVNQPIYQQTFYLRAGDYEQNLGAAAHYAKQMKFTGGLTDYPIFDYITVTFTFDSTWQLLKSDIKEAYTATMGITVNCSSDFSSKYEYNTPKAHSDAYENYFKEFVGKDINNNVTQELDAIGCLTSAFLTKPCVFELDLSVDGKKTNGVIALDASKLDIASIMSGGSVDIGAALSSVGLQARIGDIYLYLEGSTAYIKVGELKAKLPVNDLLDLVLPKETMALAEGAGDSEEEAPLFAMSELVEEVRDGQNYAHFGASLNLGSLKIPLEFDFKIDENQKATLNYLTLDFAYEGIEANVSIKGTDKNVPALENKDSYINLYPYAEAVYHLIEEKKLAISLGFEKEGITLAGNIDLDFANGLLLNGELRLSDGKNSKTLGFAAQDGIVYLNLDGIKLSVNLADAKELIGGFLTSGTANGNVKSVVDKVLSAIFDNDIASQLSLSEADNVVTLGVKGTELLKIFGVDFDLGDVALSVDQKSGAIRAEGYGATIAVGALENNVTIDKTGYAEITPYAEALTKLLTGESIFVSASYENANLGGNKLSVGLHATIRREPFAASADIAISYGSLEKKIGVVYSDDVLYLTLDGLKVKASAEDAGKLISSILPDTEKTESGDGVDVVAIIKQILAIDFGELLSVSETPADENAGENSLNVIVKGTELLKLFGVNFDLGDVALKVNEKGLYANALGINLSAVSGGSVKTITESEAKTYFDLGGLLKVVPDILETKQLSLSGSVTLTKPAEVNITLNNVIVSWKNGFELYADAALRIGDTQLNLVVDADENAALVRVGSLSLEIVYKDLETVGNEFVKLYNRIADTLNPISDQAILPEAKNLADIVNFIAGCLGVGSEGGSELSLKELTIANSEKPNGILSISIFGVVLDLIDDSATENGIVTLTLGLKKSSVQAEGVFTVKTHDGVIPAVNKTQQFIGTQEIVNLLDYVGAIFGTLNENYFRFEISGSVVSDEKVKDESGNDTVDLKYPDGKYEIAGEAELYSGESTLIHLDVENSHFWLDTDAYLRVKFSLIPKTEYDKGVYVELFMLDCDPSGAKDGTLDVYVSISMRKNATASRPLNIYAPADELMPVISSLASLLGADAKIVTDYLIEPWLDVRTAGELKALGNAFKDMLAGLLGGATVEARDGGATELSKLAIGGEKLEIALSSGFALTIGKENLESGSRLSMISVKEIESGNDKISVGVNLAYTEKEGGLEQPSYTELFEIKGVANLLKMIAHSTTHEVSEKEVISGEEQKHDYRLNEYFYIDGNITLDINVIGMLNVSVNLKLVALSVTLDEDGVWGVNVRLEYDAVKVGGLNIVVINGDTTVDLTGKNNMVYVKRVQTSDADHNKYPVPETAYRVMPLNNFVGDLINQAGFLFNLGSIITDNLASIGGGSESTEQKPEEDIGATFWNLFKSFTVEYGETDEAGQKVAGDTYTVTLNGGAILNGLKDISVGLGSDKDGKLRSLKLSAELSTTGISLIASADFAYRNPCGVMDEDVTDVTSDIEKVVSEAMDKVLKEANEKNWEGLTYIEGQTTTISYSVFGEVVATQQVFFNTLTGECYAELKTPEMNIKGYTVEWEIPAKVSTNLVIYGKCTPKVYHVTLHDQNGELADVSFDYTYGDDLAEKLKALEKEGYRIADASSVTQDAIVNGTSGFTVVWEKYDYTVTYVYDGAEYAKQYYKANQEIALAAAPEKTGYVGVWYLGGVKVEEGFAVTDNVTLELVFEENVDPVVTLRLYSDVKFTCDGKQSNIDLAENAYYIDVTINTDTNDVLPALSASGYQQMGWWYFDGEAWSQKTSAKKLSGAKLWAMWIQNIKVRITDFYTNDFMGGKQYNIGGTTTGGTVFGKKSSEIFSTLGMQENAEAMFVIRGANAGDTVDNPGGKAKVDIAYDSNGIGSFMKTGMNSSAYSGMLGVPRASYGGVVLTKTFTYNGLSITTESGAVVSYGTVAVKFLDYDGSELASVDARLDCPFDEYDSAIYLDEIVPACKEVEGYTWNEAAHTAVTESMTYSLYTINSYNITLTSEDGFVLDGETYTSKTVQLNYGGVINLIYGGETIQKIVVGAADAEYALPSLLELTGSSNGEWLPATYSVNGFDLIATAASDKLTMTSAVAFTYGGESRTELTAEYRDSYTLPAASEMVAEGYTFLGWYENTSSGWVQRTELTSRSGAEITVEALWISDLSVSVTNATRNNKSGWITVKYDHQISAAITGGELVGALASEAQVKMTYKYYVNNDGLRDDKTVHTKHEYGAYTAADTSDTFNNKEKSKANVLVEISYTYGGKVIKTVSAHASRAFE